MGEKKSREDTDSQKWGRLLIFVSGCCLAALFGTSMRSVVNHTTGTNQWWAAVLQRMFHSSTATASWTLLVAFVVGNVLNVWGLRQEIGGFKFTIRGLMIVVGIVALICLSLRFWPPLGLALLLMASLSLAMVIRKTWR